MAPKMIIIPIGVTNFNGPIEKSMPPTPHQKKGGQFLWQVQNDTLDDIVIDLVNFSPVGLVKIVSKLPTTAPAGGVALVQGNVARNPVQLETKVTYDFKVDGKKVDPDLIIDGDGGGPRPKGGGKKKGGKKR